VLTRSTPGGASIAATAWTRISFNDWYQTNGPQTVHLEFSGAEILAPGVPGPYDAKLRIVPANVIIDPVVAHTTATYDLAAFDATGAKAARLPAVTIVNPASGSYEVSLE